MADPDPMRVNAAAAVGALVATLLAVAADAAHPAQLVVTVAAGFGFLAVLSLGRRAAPRDWFTVQVLLAGNLVVFGVTEARQLGVALAALVVSAGLLLVGMAIWMRQRWHG